MQNLAPVALFVYNRPDHMRRTLSYLQKNELAADSRLFVFSDGASTDNDKEAVEEVRQIAAGINGFRSVKIIRRKQNMGLANSIISGVTQLVNEYGKIIVFEDDLLSSPYALRYFNDALNRYNAHERVMHISAYMFNLQNPNLPDTFFFRAAFSWGWATWARAWKNFEPDIDQLTARFDKEKIDQFSIEGTMNFWKQLQGFKAGKNNSWAIRWYASVFLNKGLTLNPRHSLIHNIGHDGTGVHSNIENTYEVQMAQKAVTYFPGVLQEHEPAYNAIKLFLKNRKGSFLQRAMRYFKKVRQKYRPKN